MASSDSIPCSSSLTPSTDSTHSIPGFMSCPSPSPSSSSSSSSPSVSRLWRPAAQRNLKNQWSKLASHRHQWLAASSTARSHATSVVNSYLSHKYAKTRELGVLSDMPDIRNKARQKLLRQLDYNQIKLISSYKEMVEAVANMSNTCGSMRIFVKGANNSPLVQFSYFPEDKNDLGDGRGIPVFTFWSMSYIEKLGKELVEMFMWELHLKRLLVVELLAINSEEAPQLNRLCWSDELYPGEFDDLGKCSLYCKETCELVPPTRGYQFDRPAIQSNHQPEHEVLQVYLTAWLSEVNINTCRVDEIFEVIGEEMHVKLL